MSDQPPYQAPGSPPGHPPAGQPGVPGQGTPPPGGYPPGSYQQGGQQPGGYQPGGYQPGGYQQGGYQQGGYGQGGGYPPGGQPPAYQPLGGAPPGYPPQTYGGVPVPPPKESRTGLWVGLGILAVFLIVGAVALVAVVLPRLQEGDATPSAPQTVAGLTLSAPQTVAGLTLSTDTELQTTAEQMNAQLRQELEEASGSVAAFYQDPSDATKLVMLVGVAGRVRSPDAELDQAFSEMSGAGMTATNIHDVDPGSLGGEARCGEGSSVGVPVIVCAWADRGSVGMIAFFNRDPAASEDLFRQIRGVVETRG